MIFFAKSYREGWGFYHSKELHILAKGTHNTTLTRTRVTQKIYNNRPSDQYGSLKNIINVLVKKDIGDSRPRVSKKSPELSKNLDLK